MGSKASKLDRTEVMVTYTVSRELTYVTTARDIRAMLIAAGDLVNEPDLSDLDPRNIDATDLVHRLLDANPSIGRDAWLTTVSADVNDENVTIDEVNEI